MSNEIARGDGARSADGLFAGVHGTVLHIDDSPELLGITEEYITGQLPQYRFITATDASAVADQLAEGVDCVISEYTLPDSNALELLSEVRTHDPDLPFILYTGRGSEEVAAKALNAGITGYYQKGGPDQLDRLTNRVEHAVNEYRATRNSRRYRTVLQALGYPIYVVDRTERFTYVNEGFTELTGYTRDELVGASPALIKSDESVAKANETLRSLVSTTGREREAFRVEIQTKDGEKIQCRDHMAALSFDDEFRGSVGILREITTEQKRYEQLERERDRLGEFASVVSHDLRNPLNVIGARVELLAADHDSEHSKHSEHIEAIERNIDRMEAIIEDLVTLARDGNTVGDFEPVDVAEVSRRCWQSVVTDDATIDINTTRSIYADTSQLKRIFENLYQNAIEHGGDDADVLITVGEMEEGIFVADDGVGVPPENRERIFETGYSTTEDNMGFGLRIVERIVNAHGWEISVTDAAAGGTRFEITGIEFVRPEPAS